MSRNLLDEIKKSSRKSTLIKILHRLKTGNLGRSLGLRLDDVTPVNEKVVKGSKLFPSNDWQLFGLLILMFLTTLVFVARAFNLQVLGSSEYLALAQRNRTRSYTIPSPRGVIYDRNGEVLARNRPTFNLILNVPLCSIGDDLSLCKNIISDISNEIPLNAVELISMLEKISSETMVIAEDIGKDEIIIVESRNYPALDVLSYTSREYIYPKEFAHLIGYTGLSPVSLSPVVEGKGGIEQHYDEYLQGIPGSKIIQVNSRNEKIQEFDTSDPVPGQSIILYVDLGLQKLAFDLLEEAVTGPDSKADAGVVIAQDPSSGGILALVNYPSFDSQKMVSDITTEELVEIERSGKFPFFNRAIAGTYAPGSIFKMVMGSAILEEGVATPYDTIFCPGYISVAGYTFRNWKLDGHGTVDLLRAIQVSNDPYFYIMGGGYEGVRGLGIERINKWASLFGYGSKTGIDIPGEEEGFVPYEGYKDWYLGDTYITSIGQGDFLATPLQINMVTSYFANGGELISPRVVASIGGDVPEKNILAQDLTSETTMAYIREGLKRAAEPGGTGYPFFDFPSLFGIDIAGKTGTSEYTDTQGRERTHALFTVWGPYENPEISLTVFLEGGGGGAGDAAPIARELFDYWFSK